MARSTSTPAAPTETRLDEDTTKPSTTAPGDGPADTTDPTERASSVPFSPDAEALARGTVNAVTPVPAPPAPETGDERFEEYEVTLGGRTAKVRRNLDTGESKVVEPVEVEGA